MRKVILLGLVWLLCTNIQAQLLVDPAGAGGFELGNTFTANGWTVVNGTQTNQWYLGNPATPVSLGATGTRAAFISNNGTNYQYTITASSVVHFYRDIIVPAGRTVNLSFNWRAQAENCCDYIQVFLVATTTTPAAGTQLTSGQIGSNLNSQTNWQSASFTSIFCNNTAAPITRRLVFSWRNNGSLGTNPPGGIDNISVTAVPIPLLCNLGTGVTNVTSLPYSSGAGTTCGAVNDLTSSNTVTCGSSFYLGGEDRVWVFTPTTSGVITINLTSSGSYTGLMLYDGCPTCSTLPSGTCIANSQSSSGSKSLCFNAIAGTTYYLVLDSWPLPACNAYTNLTISAPVPLPPPPTTCTLAGTYSITSITHDPDNLSTPNLSGFVDDVFYPGGTITTGFDFCLNGNQYQNFLISSNGYIIFDPPAWTCGVTNLPSGVNAVPNGFSNWSITADLPNTTNAPRNAILAPWHDIDPSINTTGGHIRYQVFGTAPNRRFVVSWENVPMYSFDNACKGDRSLDFTGQIKMFETTNNIEIHLTRKRVCASWNSGRALLGLHNYNGTEALVPAPATTYNNITTTWTATNQAWRFTFNPTTCTTCSPLPLNLLYFTGEFDKENLQSVLTWSFKTLAEADYFVIERSQDEVNFTEIGKVNFSASNQYRFIDDKPLRHTNIYRLKKVDKLGKTEYSHHVRVYNPVLENWAVEGIYPNPAQNLTNIDLVALFNESYTIQLFNLQGVEVYTQKGKLNKGFNQVEVKFGNLLPKGTYLLLLSTPSQMYQHKLVIE